MTKYAIGLLAGLAAACANASEQQGAGAACAPPITLDLSGVRPSVSLTVANAAPRRAIFDTGAMATVINVEEAAAFGLRNEGPLAPPFDRAHAASGYQATLRHASLGGMPLAPTSVSVMPLPLPGYAAIFSPNSFAGRLVTLDFSGQRLLICERRPDTTPSGPGHGYSSGAYVLPSIPVVVGEQTIGAMMDTGSPMGLIFPLRYAPRLRLAAPMRQVGNARTHNGSAPIYAAQILGRVQVGPLTLQDPEVRFTDVVPEVNVGTALLRRLSVTIDPERRRVWAVEAR